MAAQAKELPIDITQVTPDGVRLGGRLAGTTINPNVLEGGITYRLAPVVTLDQDDSLIERLAAESNLELGPSLPTRRPVTENTSKQ